MAEPVVDVLGDRVHSCFLSRGADLPPAGLLRGEVPAGFRGAGPVGVADVGGQGVLDAGTLAVPFESRHFLRRHRRHRFLGQAAAAPQRGDLLGRPLLGEERVGRGRVGAAFRGRGGVQATRRQPGVDPAFLAFLPGPVAGEHLVPVRGVVGPSLRFLLLGVRGVVGAGGGALEFRVLTVLGPQFRVALVPVLFIPAPLDHRPGGTVAFRVLGEFPQPPLPGVLVMLSLVRLVVLFRADLPCLLPLPLDALAVCVPAGLGTFLLGMFRVVGGPVLPDVCGVALPPRPLVRALLLRPGLPRLLLLTLAGQRPVFGGGHRPLPCSRRRWASWSMRSGRNPDQ
ncbi:hypothetical protein RS82_03479 [Microbacterium trichothecenolyticum]|uniref:Uncharacterized protein n=1 Tax=Microbacterium trichothecenolyticum TaxID=69370 RepID=A0A0M2H7R7_MICTR|nr:hypothetical protein RS82_03479 [Microbacterium trichothecenolyticum]